MGAACAAACALGAGMLSAQEARSYAWYAELVAVDQAAKTMTVKAQTREAVNRYIGNYEPGDKLMLTWVPVEGEADTIVYTPKYEVRGGLRTATSCPPSSSPQTRTTTRSRSGHLFPTACSRASQEFRRASGFGSLRRCTSQRRSPFSRRPSPPKGRT